MLSIGEITVKRYDIMLNWKDKGCDNYMKLKIFAVTILAAVALTACNEDETSKGNSSPENETQNIKELVSDYISKG